MVKAKNLADDKPIKDNKKDTEVQYKGKEYNCIVSTYFNISFKKYSL